MTDKEKLEAIRAEIHRLVDVRGYDREMANDLFAFMDSLPNEPESEELEDAARSYSDNLDNICGSIGEQVRNSFKAGAKWQKEHLWKPADGDDLPEIDREIIVLCKNGRVAFGHRPVEKFKARPIGYGRTEMYEVETYDKGGWNIPNIKYWLDIEISKKK